VADITDPALKERIDGLKAIRDQAQADAARAQTSLATSGEDAVTPAMVAHFAETARRRMRMEGGGYRRDHLRALAQRVEVGAKEVRIIGSKGDLLRSLAAVSGGKTATLGVPSLGLRWRSERDSNRLTPTAKMPRPQSAP
ncbi:MAG TPA: recombinase family protein, partial [Ancylobacter sp.]